MAVKVLGAGAGEEAGVALATGALGSNTGEKETATGGVLATGLIAELPQPPSRSARPIGPKRERVRARKTRTVARIEDSKAAGVRNCLYSITGLGRTAQ
jgi:hypothetical protein